MLLRTKITKKKWLIETYNQRIKISVIFKQQKHIKKIVDQCVYKPDKDPTKLSSTLVDFNFYLFQVP